ncbi:A/G-specific adenine glycosylase [Methanolapillus ohkumae]|uniref:Adenine DNA glycosylase n=1 Tax=Methanolapillus ohkumae TaxID=3028298 RepID=A0AA96V7W8_9EURY|nr:Adenine DNA glycosylase [Methanosarcinaceae archaeon Am2]
MAKKSISTSSVSDSASVLDISSKLLSWYDVYGRDLPWRVVGAHPNPYVVWVSEIMLQQTTVQTVIPYFYKFMERFPTIEILADADIEDVLLLWQGLGYYTRAKKLHECAQRVVSDFGGKFPKTYAELLKLPGIGPYTAASISSLAFDKPEAVVDGNVIRVISRLYSMTEELDQIKPEISKRARQMMPQRRAADYTSAIMDLGATVCTPKNPVCESCPLQSDCGAKQKNLVGEIPKIVPLKKVQKSGPLFWIENESGSVYICKRHEGLLSGLWEFPWMAEETTKDMPPAFNFPFESDWIFTKKSIRHTFTHIQLSLFIYRTKTNEQDPDFLVFQKKTGGSFVPQNDFKDYPFSTLMKKVIHETEDAKNKKMASKKTEFKDMNLKKTEFKDMNLKKTEKPKIEKPKIEKPKIEKLKIEKPKTEKIIKQISDF